MSSSLVSDVKLKKRGKFKVIEIDGQTGKGITKLAAKCFYPNYNFHELDKYPSNKKKKVKGGIKTGNQLDREVQQSVKLQKEYSLPFDSFFCSKEKAERIAKEKSMLVTHKKQLLAAVNDNKRVPYVQGFWKLMRGLQLRPVETQLGVKHETFKLATLLDVVCLDTSTGKYHIIELKTGGEGYYTKANGNMNYPFQDQTNCQANQHQIQLAIEERFFKATFPTRTFESHIMLFDNDGIVVIELKDIFRARIDAALEVMAKRTDRKRKSETSNSEKKTKRTKTL